MEKKTFVLHDESVNTHGFRMLTNGADLTEFIKNPVMFLNHADWNLPIGRWENIRKEGGRILADSVFDEDDPRALEVMRKVENNFIRMASIGAWPPEETSDAYALMLPRQTLPTVTKWTVREASIVTIGANHNALVFFDGNYKDEYKVINLSTRNDCIRLMDSNNPKNKIKMSVLTEVLKLHDGASEADMVSAVQSLVSDRDRLKLENKTLADAIDKQNAERKDSEKKQAVTLVDAAIKEGRIDAKGRAAYLEMFDKDFTKSKELLDAIPSRGSVTTRIKDGNNHVDMGDWKNKSWDELDKAGKLLELKDNHPELYSEKYELRFGVKIQL